MLVLSRGIQQSVAVDCSDGFKSQLKVTVLGIRGGKVKLGFDVEDGIPIPQAKLSEQSYTGCQRNIPKHSDAASKEAINRWDDDGGGRPDQSTTVPIFDKVSWKESLRNTERNITRQQSERGKS